MCTVEVLLIGDVMRHTSFRNDNNNNNAARPSARSVCRKLFTNDPMDRRDSSRILRQIEEELNLEMSKKWNFDFQTGTPLPGRYQWEPVGVTKTAPASSPINITTPADASSSQTIDEDAGGVVVAEVNSELQDGPKDAKGYQRKSEVHATPTKQPKITDYMNQRKRHRDDKIVSPKLKVRRTSSSAATCSTVTTTTSAPPPAT